MITDVDNMDSIWVEDGRQHGSSRVSKFHLNDPNVKIVNSETPLLSSKKHIELPPLPPSSFFSYSLENEETTSKKNNFFKLFKKSSCQSLKQSDKKVKKKISTPFGFNHVSHIDNQGSVINVNKMAEVIPIDPNSIAKQEDTVEELQSPNSGSRSNRTSTSAKAFCTSPQIPMMNSSSISTKNIPRSISNATSLSRSSSSQIFQRSGSISTMATTISSKTHSKKNSIPMAFTANTTQSIIPTTTTTTNTNHKHQNSSDSIENLKKLEKNQISKQCSIDYSSNYKFPSSNSHHRDLNNWGTPDPASASRQSWIYEDLSPKSPSKTKTPTLKRSNSICGASPTLHSPYNVKKDLNLFQNEVEMSFNDVDEGVNLNELINSIDDFSKFFKNVPEIPDLEEYEDEEEEDDELAMRAAKFSRLSRLDNFYQNDPRYLSFLDEFQKRNTLETTTTTTETTTESTNTSSSPVHYSSHSKNQSLQISEISETGPLELGKCSEVPEISELSESEEESTPRQHHISTLLPPMV